MLVEGVVQLLDDRIQRHAKAIPAQLERHRRAPMIFGTGWRAADRTGPVDIDMPVISARAASTTNLADRGVGHARAHRMVGKPDCSIRALL